MKITLISVSPSPADQGIRTISSVLKKAGYEVKLVFMRLDTDYSKLYDEKELSQLSKLCSDSSLIGINAFASNSKRTIQIIKFLRKKLNIPICWGGVHATISPEDCIKYSDIVCVGEGEGAIIDLSKAIEGKKPIENIKNLWIRKGDKIIKNPVRDLIDNLDIIPFPDYDLKNHYILKENQIKKMVNKDLFQNIMFLTGRGCPYGCDYCSNSTLNELYKNKRKKIVRSHSIDYIIKFLRFLKEKFPEEFNYADLRDDVFLLRPIEEIKKFTERYKKEINLPLRCLTSPEATNDEKIKLLIDAGCIEISMGIESSERVNKEIYHRNSTDNSVLNAAKILNKYKERLVITYDILACNPYEKLEDTLNTINLLKKVPKPYYLNVCNLVFFPGSKLYDRAKNDGIIKTEKDTSIHLNYADRCGHILSRRKNINVYLNLILNLMRGNVTDRKYGILSNSLLNFLTEEKRVKNYSKKPFLAIMFIYSLKRYEMLKNVLIKVYLSLPRFVRMMYIRLRHGNDLHYLNLEKFR